MVRAVAKLDTLRGSLQANGQDKVDSRDGEEEEESDQSGGGDAHHNQRDDGKAVMREREHSQYKGPFLTHWIS